MRMLVRLKQTTSSCGRGRSRGATGRSLLLFLVILVASFSFKLPTCATLAFSPAASNNQNNGNANTNSKSQQPPPVRVTKQAIAGLWRLTPQPTYPLKEFTVYPPKQPTNRKGGWTHDQHKEELLLMLNEDGSFQQYMETLKLDEEDDDDDDNDGGGTMKKKKSAKNVDVDDQWSQFQRQQKEASKQNEDYEDNDDFDSSSSSSSPLASLSNQLAKGIWDFVDGKLILAADRPLQDQNSKNAQQTTGNKQIDNIPMSQKTAQLPSQGDGRQSRLDKLIVGRVVASSPVKTTTTRTPPLSTAAPSQSNRPAQSKPTSTKNGSDDSTSSSFSKEVESDGNESKQDNKETSTGSSPSSYISNCLSVPKGSLKMGKFFYPKNHPSFFDQPIYNPTTASRRFELKQILGSVKQSNERTLMDGDDIYDGDAPFARSDFYNKTFLLSSHPLRQPKKPTSPDPFTKRANREAEAMSSLFQSKKSRERENVVNPHAESAHIRVMQIKFFPNNTFATVWGTGDVILRGKFDTFVRDGYNSRRHRDNDSSSSTNQPPTVALWMQILRFGFGRSVSGSVYSEGRALTHEDAKTYWGTIRRVNATVLGSSSSEAGTSASSALKDDVDDSSLGNNYEDVVNGVVQRDDENDSDNKKRNEANQGGDTVSMLEVEGSVLFGTGVGAEPVGRFLMREMMQELNQEDEEEDEHDEEEEDDNEEFDYDEEEISSKFTLPEFPSSSSPDNDSNKNRKPSETNANTEGIDWNMYDDGDGNAFQ